MSVCVCVYIMQRTRRRLHAVEGKNRLIVCRGFRKICCSMMRYMVGIEIGNEVEWFRGKNYLGISF